MADQISSLVKHLYNNMPSESSVVYITAQRKEQWLKIEIIDIKTAFFQIFQAKTQ